MLIHKFMLVDIKKHLVKDAVIERSPYSRCGRRIPTRLENFLAVVVRFEQPYSFDEYHKTVSIFAISSQYLRKSGCEDPEAYLYKPKLVWCGHLYISMASLLNQKLILPVPYKKLGCSL